jgi:hypothetical protein
MLFLSEGDFFSGVTWQKIVGQAVISVTCTLLALWVLKKYRKL